MFGATAVRRKRERERREKAARGLEPPVFPFIKPFGPRFDKNQLPYFKYQQTFRPSDQNKDPSEVGVLGSSDVFSVFLDCFRYPEV